MGGIPNIAGFGIAVVLAALLLLSAGVGLFLHLLLVAPVREDARRCVQRRFACWFGTGGFLVGCVLAPLDNDDLIVVSVLGPALVGVGAGAGLGTLVGLIVWLCLKPNAEEEGS